MRVIEESKSNSADLPLQAEVVVIGTGVLGAATAFHLSELKKDVVLIDRGPLASETSSQGAGFLCSIRPTVSSTRLSYYSTLFYSRFEEETGYAIDLHMVGGLRVAMSNTRMDELLLEVEAANEANVDAYQLSKGGIADLIATMNTAGIIGGTFVPTEGYMTSTRDAAVGFARGAVRRGARVKTHLEVREVRVRASGEFDVVTQNGTIVAEKLVFAANAGMWALAQQLGVIYPSYPLLHECAVYGFPTSIPPSMPTVRIQEQDLYIRHEMGGLLIGSAGKNPIGPSPEDVGQVFALERTIVSPVEIEAARNRSTRFFNEINDGISCREQRGLALVAPDLEPVAGEWMPNLFVISADLRGIQLGPGLGLMIAQLISSNESEFDYRPYQPSRFSKFDGSLEDVYRLSRTALGRGYPVTWT